MARVLVIDDEESLRLSLATSLTAAGHEVVLAEDGDEGVEKHRALPADLIVVDLYMNKQDGFETMRLLREDFPKVPIIAISGGHLSEQLLTASLRLGANTVLQKPFDQKVFLTAVKELLP